MTGANKGANLNNWLVLMLKLSPGTHSNTIVGVILPIDIEYFLLCDKSNVLC